MSTSKMQPRIKGFLTAALSKSLADGQVTVERLVHIKPWIAFERPGQFQNPETGELENVTVEFHFQIDPRKLRGEHNNRISAVRDRISTAQRIYERMASAVGGNAAVSSMTAADLPQTELLTGLYDEMDAAGDDRLLDLITTDDMNQPNWDYVDENGLMPVLNADWLRRNYAVAEAMQTALVNQWLNPTKASSEATTTTKPASTRDTTTETAGASFTGSPTPSTVPAKSNPTGDADTSQDGMSNSS